MLVHNTGGPVGCNVAAAAVLLLCIMLLLPIV